MKIKTSELTRAALDWAVAKCEGGYNFDATGLPWDVDASNSNDEENGAVWFKPSTDWTQGGPIIEREAIQLTPDEYTQTWSAYTTNEGNPYECVGTTPLIAAMRCYVASKIGDEVEVPNEVQE